MGFSLSVSVRSHRLKEEMHGFLLSSYKPWSELVEDDDTQDSFQGPYVDEELDTPGKCCIGFDYHPVPGAEREYHFALVRWIALQVGKRRSSFRGEGLSLPTPVPYVLFDGIEASPVLLQSRWPTVDPVLRPHIVDNFGMRVDDSVAEELAWYCLPEGVFEKVTATHHGRHPDSVREALVKEGMGGAQELIDGIRAQISELDTLWRERNRG